MKNQNKMGQVASPVILSILRCIIVYLQTDYIYLVNADSKGEPNIISYFGYSSIE